MSNNTAVDTTGEGWRIRFLLTAFAVACLTTALGLAALIGVSYAAGGKVPMLILCAYLFPISPSMLLVPACLALCSWVATTHHTERRH